MDRPDSLEKASTYIRERLQLTGYAAKELPYQTGSSVVHNIEAILEGQQSPAESVVVGAHYDSLAGTVGADDNATGVAATMELARLLHGSKLRRTMRFVFFVDEEPAYFQTQNMGSWQYARDLRRDGVRVTAMISLETIGFYSDAENSQKYPAVLGLFYPNRGNFIGFVGNSESRDVVRKSIRRFRETTQFPSEGVAAPPDLPGVGWSDQWSFWQQNYPAIMITDTAVFRYSYYHTVNDSIGKIDFEKTARVVDGVRQVVEALANGQ
jgi:hypothetical protein